MYKSISLFISLLLITFPSQSQQTDKVKVWEENLELPTYLVDDFDKNPQFFRNLSYQGASRVIYPYALQDVMTGKKENKIYKALYIENRYIKLCVLPEIGGRLFYATDKTNNYEIFYRQHVIKPANIGMLGAWISGGIEFCVFHHHRATANLPVDYTITNNKDGSATIWVGEIELRHRMKWNIGITLYPNSSIVEVRGNMMNTTATTNSILYWANVATHVNEDYQVIFPPSTNFGTFHAKNSFTHWPVSKEAYNGREYYKNNVDISWWKNHRQQISIFAYDLKEGFSAGYDHGKQAGTMHVANHNIVKGAKLWEWSPGKAGAIWDTKILTDSDGPYAELMTGAYSDNQPDYSWIKPYENKTFKQIWYPLRETRGAKTANKFATLNLEVLENNKIFFAANTTRLFNGAILKLMNSDKIIFEDQVNISPEIPYNNEIKIAQKTNQYDLKLILSDSEGNEIISYTPLKKEENLALPEALKPPIAPENIKTIEELYYTGLRIKQFHNARFNPNNYFEEGLKRDPEDVRTNIQMGIYYRENFNPEKASFYQRKAIKRITDNYTRPRDCEALFELGVNLQSQKMYESAYDTLYRSAWDNTYRSPAYYHLAQIDVINGNLDKALEHINLSLVSNTENINALCLKSSILRKLGKYHKAENAAIRVLEIDVLNFQANNELFIIYQNNNKQEDDQLLKLNRLLRNIPENYLELAVFYLNCGLKQESYDILKRAYNSKIDRLSNYPTIIYYLGYISNQMGDKKDAADYYTRASSQSVDYCFPFRFETINVYENALAYNPDDYKVLYYLGNLFYDKQPDKAIHYWERSVALNNSFAIAFRNLGWGYNYQENNPDKAIKSYEKAISIDNTQTIYFTELDRLYESTGADIKKRYKLLTDNHKTILKRNDVLEREIIVLLHMGEYGKAFQYLTDRYFYRQEGGGNIHNVYVDACLLQGRKYYYEKEYKKALEYFLMADEYPDNHLIARIERYPRNPEIYYYSGLAYEKNKNKKKAKDYFLKAAELINENSVYNYFNSMALKKLGKSDEALIMLENMIESGETALDMKTEVDFFAKFGQEVAKNNRQANECYKIGLAYLGKADRSSAKKYLEMAIRFNKNHLWANEYFKFVR